MVQESEYNYLVYLSPRLNDELNLLHFSSRRALAQIQNTLGVSGGNSVGAEDSEMTDGNAVGGQGSLDSETRETIQASVTK